MDICRCLELGDCQFRCFKVGQHKMYINAKVMKFLIGSRVVLEVKVKISEFVVVVGSISAALSCQVYPPREERLDA